MVRYVGEGLKSYELKVLKVIKNKERLEFNDLVKEVGMDQSTVSRALLTLEKIGLVEVWEQDEVDIHLTQEGERVIEDDLPENRLYDMLKDGERHVKDINLRDKDIAIAWAKKKGYISIDKGIARLNENVKKDSKERELLIKLKDGKKEEILEYVDLLKKRRFIEVVPRTKRYIKITSKGRKYEIKEEDIIEEVTPEIIVKRLWEGKRFRRYDVVSDPPSIINIGKEHFVTQAIEHIRRIWLDMGFKEMTGNIITSSFWNFDALFVPQDHPAREMQDTFYLKPENCSPIERRYEKVLKKVKEMHEKGDEESVGWGYDWDEKIARKAVLRTHTTVISAQTLASLDEIPSKFFSIGKVFRNETLDWKHLFEFYQVEGIVVSRNVNFRNLIFYLKTFFKKMGYEEIRIRPAYFPYTELSLEVEVLIPGKGWMELGGAGIFREEVIKPLIDKPGVRVLAWGMGLERIIASYYAIKDIREIYGNDLGMLRKAKRFIIKGE